MSLTKTVILSFLSLFAGTAAIAQTYEQVVGSRGFYIYAEGTGASFREADNAALAQISDQIAVEVRSNLSVAQTRQKENKDYTATTTFESVVDTYSQATLTMCQRIVVKNGPKEYRILRFIPKSEIERVFAAREDKVREMARIAERAEAELKLGDALRYYYWAQILTTTLRYPNEAYYNDSEGADQQLSVWLPMKINSILDGIEIAFDGFSDKAGMYGKLSFTYGGRPVSNLDYTYWDGFDWSYVCSAKDGMGFFELRANSSVPSINVKIEYSYDYEAHIDKEIEPVIAAVDPINYTSAYHNNIFLKARQGRPDRQLPVNGTASANKVKVEQSVARPTESFGNTSSVSSLSFAETSDEKYYQETVESIVDDIASGNYDGVSQYFTDEGYDIFTRLIHYGNARILEDKAPECLTFNGEVFCRSIPMSFSFRNNQVRFVEDVVFTFNPDRKISNISFALEDVTLNDILSKSKWEDSAKMVLIDFLENYKTAFALKRLDYLESIFSDDALIITGRVVRRANVENRIQGSAEYVEYNRQTKAEYINNLRYSFGSKEYINIRFSNMEILKMGKGDSIYSIQIKQDYYSSNYGDTGYLFLLVDASDYKRPVIHVRTWQPKPDPEFGIFGPYNF